MTCPLVRPFEASKKGHRPWWSGVGCQLRARSVLRPLILIRPQGSWEPGWELPDYRGGGGRGLGGWRPVGAAVSPPRSLNLLSFWRGLGALKGGRR